MQLKRFTAKHMTKTLRKVKDAVGNDAVILSNHEVDGGVQTVVAIDYDESAINRQLPAKIGAAIKQPSYGRSALPQNKYSDLDDVK